jgi:transposase
MLQTQRLLMFDLDSSSLRLLAGICVIAALVFGIPLLRSVLRRIEQQKKDRKIHAQRRRDEARWQQIQDEKRKQARKDNTADTVG